MLLNDIECVYFISTWERSDALEINAEMLAGLRHVFVVKQNPWLASNNALLESFLKMMMVALWIKEKTCGEDVREMMTLVLSHWFNRDALILYEELRRTSWKLHKLNFIEVNKLYKEITRRAEVPAPVKRVCTAEDLSRFDAMNVVNDFFASE
eukprot:TRINITY_DN6090_c0_g3_i2.p1 TRINITY_DN6090_c0_g3~~TRINITY_DN6090_c0_g3_i2.p1  ORF type:complete len:153 (+),score=41.38 TRINITY_DN6090_c0_g3_i2:510-968(+)